MRRPGVFVGVIALVVLGYISLNTLRTEGPGSRGVPAGTPLPPFAAPLAFAAREDEAANLSERACAVRGPRALNVCELAEAGPVVLSFFAEPSDRCVAQIDLLDRLRGRFPDVGFAAIAIKGGLDDLRRTVRERGWNLPVAWDSNAAVTNLYGVAVCPVTVFARRGGMVAASAIGTLGERELIARVRRLHPAAP